MRFWRVCGFLVLWAGLVHAQMLPGDKDAKVGDYAQAGSLYRQAEKGADAALQRRLLCRRLAVAQATNDVVTARQLGEELEARLRGVDDPEVAMRLYLLRGAIAYRTRDLPAARQAFAEARKLAERLIQPGGPGGPQGDPGAALGMYECLSYQYLSQVNNKVGASLQERVSEYEAACIRACVAAQHPVASPQRPLWTLDTYRSIFWTRLWIWQAWEYSYYAYRLQRTEEATAWANLSGGIWKKAWDFCDQAYKLTGDPEILTARTHVGLEFTENFPLNPAVPLSLYQMQSVFASLPDNVETRYMRGRYAHSWARTHFYALNDRAAALKDYLEAADWFAKGGQRIDQMDMYAEMAYLYTLDSAPADWEPTVAAKLDELLLLSQKVSYPNGRYFGLGFQGVLKARSGDLKAAEKLLRESLAQMSAWSRESGQDAAARILTLQRPEVRLFSDTLVDVLLRQNRPAEAMEVSQGIQAETESVGLDLTRVVPKDHDSVQDLKSLQQTRLRGGQLRAELQSAQIQGDTAVVQKLQGQLSNNKAEFQQTVNRLRQRDPDFEKILSVRPSSFAKLQSQLSPEVLVVEYYTSADKLVIFAVTQKDLKIFSAPLGRRELMGKVRKFRARLMQQSDDAALSGELYEALIGPLQPMLADHSVLAIIPSGSLYYLPFAALRQPGGSCLNDKTAVCLLTATELPEVGNYKSSGKPTSLLALANPDGTLPGASREVEQLSRLFSHQQTYVGAQATKDKLTGQGEVLHVATHGNLNPRDVNESYLLLAGKDGHLTAGEIYGLDLKKVSLVTLSACETALGETNPGSEVATLAQAFSFAGSRTMVASLWQVEDDSTAHFMVEFYTQLLAGKSKAESLRLAQVSVMKQPKWSSPYYWGAFELIGDWH